MKTRTKVSSLIMLIVVLGGLLYLRILETAISQTMWSGETTITRTQSGFFTQTVTNKTPFVITIEKVSFGELSTNASFDGKFFVITDYSGGIPAAEKAVPANFSVSTKPLRIAPGEKTYLGVVLSTKDGIGLIARKMVLQCRLGLVGFRVGTDITFSLEP